ncbi:MAG: hypothetical protein WA634_07680 [Silvibacterium sp.]
MIGSSDKRKYTFYTLPGQPTGSVASREIPIERSPTMLLPITAKAFQEKGAAERAVPMPPDDRLPGGDVVNKNAASFFSEMPILLAIVH